MTRAPSGFYASPGSMTALPDHDALNDLSADADGLRVTVQGLLVHRDWAAAYGVDRGDLRADEQHLRSTAEILARVIELSDAPVTRRREPRDRVVGTCRDYVLLHTAFLRAAGTPARARCGFAGYFDPSTWVDHWITEIHDGDRWVRHDPQVDELQIEMCGIGFDPYDQPAGVFLTGAEAWAAARAGEVDPGRFGIFDMKGMAFIAGNVVLDMAALNKVELLPWDWWGMIPDPHAPLGAEAAAAFDDVAALVSGDDLDAIRHRYDTDDGLRVPPDILSFRDGDPVVAHLDL